MLKHNSLIPCTLLALLAVGPSLLRAGDEQSPSANSLTGIKAFGVLIEDLGDAEKADGLNEEQLRRDVELKLRRYSLPLTKDLADDQHRLWKQRDVRIKETGQSSLPDTDPITVQLQSCWEKLLASGVIYVNVHMMKIPSVDGYIFNVELSVDQTGHLDRSPNGDSLLVVTWHKSMLGTTRRGDMPNYVRSIASDMLDSLLSDYFSKNH